MSKSRIQFCELFGRQDVVVMIVHDRGIQKMQDILGNLGVFRQILAN